MKKEIIDKAMKEMGVGEGAASHNTGLQQPTIAILTRAAKAWGRGNGPGNASRSLPGGRTVGEVLARAEEVEYPILDYPHENQQTANARLIAAAPELLDALDDCSGVLQSIEDQLKGKSFAVTAVLSKARAAISKATGE